MGALDPLGSDLERSYGMRHLSSTEDDDTPTRGAPTPGRAILDCKDDRIRRSPSLSCIMRTTVGPVRPVVPGDMTLVVLKPPETHPGCVSGRSAPGRSLLFSPWEGSCRSLERPSA